MKVIELCMNVLYGNCDYTRDNNSKAGDLSGHDDRQVYNLAL